MQNEAVKMETPGAVKEVGMANFMPEVVEASLEKPVLVQFWAPWCGPCKQLAPVLEKVVAATKGAIKLVKTNIDQNPQIAGQMGVQSVPMVFAFVGGRPVDGFGGALPESEIKKFVDKFLNAGESEDGISITDLLLAGKESILQNDLVGAVEIYAEILVREPENLEALAGLATTYLKSGDTEKAESIIAKLPEAKRFDKMIAPVMTAIQLAKESGAVGDLKILKQAAAHNPKNYEARMNYATALFGGGAHGEAVDELLMIIRENKKWNDEAARKQVVKFFEALGFDHPVSIDGRKKLASILFA